MQTNKSLSKCAVLWPAVSLAIGLTGCGQTTPTSPRQSSDTEASKIEAEWKSAKKTSTMTSFNEENGVLTQTVSKNGHPHTTTWVVAVKCSGKVGKAGTFVQATSEMTRKGHVWKGANPGILRHETRPTRILGSAIPPPKNLDTWGVSMQKACDSIFKLDLR